MHYPDFVRQTVGLILGVVLLGVAVAGVSTVVAEDTPAIDCGDHAHHDRIQINEDHGPQGFTWTNASSGQTEYRPGSGVVAGEGTLQDPFVISGWCIGAPQDSTEHGLHIDGTTAAVVVRDNVVTGSGPGDEQAAIRIENAADVVVEENLVAWAQYGIGATFSQGVVIKDNVVLENHGFGVWLGQSSQALVENNLVAENDQGISAGDGDEYQIISNTVRDNFAGITTVFSDNATIKDNQVSGNTDGIVAWNADGVRVENNDVLDHSGTAVAFDGAPGSTAVDNRVRGVPNEGIIFWMSADGTATGNSVTDAGFGDDRAGLRFAFSPDSSVTGNILMDNHQGLVLDGSPHSTVEENIVADNDGVGLYLWNAHGVTVSSNLVRGNHEGIRVEEDGEGTDLFGNNIEGNDLWGLDARQSTASVLAKGNWWGCAEGPAHGDCDDALGPVDYSSWLQAPDPAVPDAPVWRPVEEQQVIEGDPLFFEVESFLRSDDPITLSLQDAPDGATFQQTLDEPGHSIGGFSWTPDFGQSGTHRLTFVSSALGIDILMDVKIVVVSGVAKLKMDSITPAPSGVSPGDQVTLIARVRNLDGDAVTVPLNVSSSAGWNVTTPTQSLQLGPGETVHVPVEVEVGEGSLFSRVTLEAEVEGTPEVHRQVTWILEVPVYTEIELFETTTGSEITGEVSVHYADKRPVVGVPVSGVRSNGWDTTDVLQDAFDGTTNETGRLAFSFSMTELAAQTPGTHTITADARVDKTNHRGFTVYQVALPV